MSKENEFKRSLKYKEDTNESKKRLIEAYEQEFLYETVKTPHTDSEIINEDQIANLAKWNRERDWEQKYGNLSNEEETHYQYRSRRHIKNEPSKTSRALKTAGAFGLTALVALGALKVIGEINNKPINFEQAKEIGLDVENDLGMKNITGQNIDEINEMIKGIKNSNKQEIYNALIKINSTYYDVLTEKIQSATNTTGTITIGSRFEDGGTVEYVSINNKNTTDLYLEDSVVNSLVNQRTISKSIADAIEDIKGTQTYIMQIQENGNLMNIIDTAEKCKDLNEKLNKFAAVQISYDGHSFNEKVIKQSEANLEDEKNDKKSLEAQNAILDNGDNGENENDVQNANEYNDEYEEDNER